MPALFAGGGAIGGGLACEGGGGGGGPPPDDLGVPADMRFDDGITAREAEVESWGVRARPTLGFGDDQGKRRRL